MKWFFNRKKKINITIVSGLPRSGTSMMMKMLEAGGISPLTDKIRTADEDNPKGYYEFERVKKLREGDTQWLPEAEGKVVKIIAALLTYLPPDYEYKVIFMRRNMEEILASQAKMLKHRGKEQEVDNEKLAELFAKHIPEVKAWMASRPNLAYIEVDYNDMLEDPAPHVQTINEFLGGELDQEKMMGVVDPDLYRQRK